MSFTPPEGVGPVPVVAVVPLVVNVTVDASMKPVSVLPLTLKPTCP
jgi:hypothetical protein